MHPIRVSVAMAVYNGERFLREQIDSILQQLSDADELVISYDQSTDGTKTIIDSYAAADPRVRVVENSGLPGVQNNFNHAVMSCRGAYIFLADQDDVWMSEKVNAVLEVFAQTGADLVVHDAYMTTADLQIQPETIFQRRGAYDNPWKNLIRCTYWGCCMAFRASLRPLLCPFPDNVPHDHWIGILAGIRGKVARCNQVLIKHRLHDANVTSVHRRKLGVILASRAVLASALLKRLRHVPSKHR